MVYYFKMAEAYTEIIGGSLKLKGLSKSLKKLVWMNKICLHVNNIINL